MDGMKGSCVGCGEITANAIECDCTQGMAACGACCETDAPLRCAGCRRRQRQSVYPCLDYRDDRASGRDMGGCLPVAAPVGAWGLPCRAV